MLKAEAAESPSRTKCCPGRRFGLALAVSLDCRGAVGALMRLLDGVPGSVQMMLVTAGGQGRPDRPGGAGVAPARTG